MKELTISKLQECLKKQDNNIELKDKYFLKLVEEIGELANAIRKDKKMQDNNIKDTIDEELTDVIYYTICIANLYNIDLNNCIQLKEELNCKKWNRDNMFESEKI